MKTALSKTHWVAKFQCLACNYHYTEYAGPTFCPKCKSEQVKWLNYLESRRKAALKGYKD